MTSQAGKPLFSPASPSLPSSQGGHGVGEEGGAILWWREGGRRRALPVPHPEAACRLTCLSLKRNILRREEQAGGGMGWGGRQITGSRSSWWQE